MKSDCILISDQLTVTVANSVDTTAPVAAISKPADGSSITGLSKVVVSASAKDNIGVTRLELYIDDTFVSTSSSASLNLNWNTRKVASGAHSISVWAYDAVGNTGVKSITVYR